MKTYSFYHKDTGAFNGVKFSSTDPNDVELNVPADHIAIEGHHDHLSKRVENGEVVDFQPPQPSPDHEWNGETKRWQLTTAVARSHIDRLTALGQIEILEATQHRIVRESLLAVILGQESKSHYQRLLAMDDEIAKQRKIATEFLPVLTDEVKPQ
jgi:hypothetical protein